MKYLVVINATAAKESGALSILNSLISYIVNEFDPNIMRFILFTSLRDKFRTSRNLDVEYISILNWKERIQWDEGGLRSFCEKKKIKPDLIISMQNTCTKYSYIPQLVYYHQALAIIPYPWNPLHKQELVPFIYSHFYSFFVNRHNENAKYVVQLPFIKRALCRKIKSITPKNVHVVRPDGPDIDTLNVKASNEFNEGRLIYIYPATDLPFKNHEIILRSLKLLNNEILGRIRVIFTVDENSYTAKTAIKLGLKNVVMCIGSRPYRELLGIYKASHALLFPSMIESYGMPLVEAMAFGLPIIASDLPYAHEVLCNYRNASFVNSNECSAWRDAIIDSLKISNDVCAQSNKESSWKTFMELAQECIKESKFQKH